MNYFEFYDLPISFDLDENLVKKKFYELSKKYHPDFFVNDSEAKQQEILELSTLNNKAFQVLSNPKKRTEYILQLQGILIEGEKYQLPQAFLMEMMEVNEAVMELEFAEGGVAAITISEQVNAIEEALNREFVHLTTSFESQSESQRAETLKEVKDLYYRQKYLLRIRDSLDRFASRN